MDPTNYPSAYHQEGLGAGSATHLEAIDAEIAAILDEARTSYATHNRKLKELSLFRAKSSSSVFFSAFSRTLTPLFDFQRRLASVERVVSFVSALAASASDEFPDCFLKFLLAAATTSNKTVRFRACQIVSEIILRLPDDAEVSNEIWDEVIEWMMVRVRDKIPMVRTFAVRALSRFVNDSLNSDILDLYLEVLPLEQNAVSVTIRSRPFLFVSYFGLDQLCGFVFRILVVYSILGAISIEGFRQKHHILYCH
ncbi:uncharacterized protein LOC128195832 [Vigna angularis]|uniref:uncharacterized protein LOC128195832 n=1 Tax=Phaseolus angularis TaxID=3914 RepID=UPI0022B5452A|nr:uncharacterized protein LOC128195832 [Vigna angularis]